MLNNFGYKLDEIRSIYSRGVNRAGLNAGRAGPGRARADFLNCRPARPGGPGLTWPRRAERFYNLLERWAGFL